MDKSPWSAYGRKPPQREGSPSTPARDDVTLGALDNVERGRQQLQKCLERAMQDYHDSDRDYRQLIDDALSPSPQPETIEERLRRLAHETTRRRRPGPQMR